MTKFPVEVPLGSDAIVHGPTDSAKYEPSDEVAEWLDERTGHYWFYEPWWEAGNQWYGWNGLRFFLPTEDCQLMFKLAWGGK